MIEVADTVKEKQTFQDRLGTEVGLGRIAQLRKLGTVKILKLLSKIMWHVTHYWTNIDLIYSYSCATMVWLLCRLIFVMKFPFSWGRGAKISKHHRSLALAFTWMSRTQCFHIINEFFLKELTSVNMFCANGDIASWQSRERSFG